MATLNIRYGGEIIEIPEGFTYNPQSYGIYRLNYKINNNSTGRIGFTTNSNATEYCKLKFRINGNICYIGRVSSTTYISGNTPYYNGSIIGNMSSISSSSSEVVSNTLTAQYNISSTSMNTATGIFTSVTKTQQVETKSQTRQVWTRSDTSTRNAGNGSGTAAANPTVRTVTNNTGSSVTTRTASEQLVASQSTKATNINNGYQVGTYAANPGTSAYWSGNSYYNRSRTASEQLVKSSSTGAINVTKDFLAGPYTANPGISTYWSGNSYFNRSRTASEAVVSKSASSYTYSISDNEYTVTHLTSGFTVKNKTKIHNYTSTGIRSVLKGKYTANKTSATFSQTHVTTSKVTTISASLNQKSGSNIAKTDAVTISVKTATGTRSGTDSLGTFSASYTLSSYTKTSAVKWSITKTATGTYKTTTKDVADSFTAYFGNQGTTGYSSYSTRWSAVISSYYRQSYYTYSTRWTAWANSYYRSTDYTYSTRWSYWWTSCEKITNNYYSTATDRYYSTASSTGSTYYTSITRSTTSVSETIHNYNI